MCYDVGLTYKQSVGLYIFVNTLTSGKIFSNNKKYRIGQFETVGNITIINDNFLKFYIKIPYGNECDVFEVELKIIDRGCNYNNLGINIKIQYDIEEIDKLKEIILTEV